MSNNDELLIISPLDQSIDVEDDDHVLEKIEKMILDSIEEHNYMQAINICTQLIQVTKLSGLALAKSLYLIKSRWSEFDIHDTFEDTLASRTGLTKATLQRYTSVWSMYAENKIPDEYAEQVRQMNIRSQVPIAQALDAGYEIEKDGWEELVSDPDFSSVNNTLREIKGKDPRPQALLLMMDRDGGIKALKKGKQVYVGWLNIDDEDEIVQQAISRITRGGGILEQ